MKVFAIEFDGGRIDYRLAHDASEELEKCVRGSQHGLCGTAYLYRLDENVTVADVRHRLSDELNERLNDHKLKIQEIEDGTDYEQKKSFVSAYDIWRSER